MSPSFLLHVFRVIRCKTSRYPYSFFIDATSYWNTFVFHFEYWKQGTKGIGGYKHGSSGHKGKYELGHLVKNEQKNFSKSGVYQKFKKMVKHLNLNDDLTPHSCRRYFITEMLKRTNGNIPLVAQLVGHSNWDMVRRYSKSVITDETEVNINLKEIVSKNN